MPWVRPVAPEELKKTVRRIVPGAEVWSVDDEDEEGDEGDVDGEIGVGRENGNGNVNGSGSGDVGMEGDESGIGEGVEGMRRALRWAVRRMSGGAGDEEEQEREGLVVVAGSLYLVADFYRLLQQHQQMQDRTD